MEFCEGISFGMDIGRNVFYERDLERTRFLTTEFFDRVSFGMDFMNVI